MRLYSSRPIASAFKRYAPSSSITATAPPRSGDAPPHGRPGRSVRSAPHCRRGKGLPVPHRKRQKRSGRQSLPAPRHDSTAFPQQKAPDTILCQRRGGAARWYRCSWTRPSCRNRPAPPRRKGGPTYPHCPAAARTRAYPDTAAPAPRRTWPQQRPAR